MAWSKGSRLSTWTSLCSATTRAVLLGHQVTLPFPAWGYLSPLLLSPLTGPCGGLGGDNVTLVLRSGNAFEQQLLAKDNRDGTYGVRFIRPNAAYDLELIINGQMHDKVGGMLKLCSRSLGCFRRRCGGVSREEEGAIGPTESGWGTDGIWDYGLGGICGFPSHEPMTVRARCCWCS